MNREIKAVALVINAQLAHDNLSYEQADKLVSSLVSVWQRKGVPFDKEAFEKLALKGEQ